MNWQDTINYIKSKDVALFESFKGLSLEYVKKIEEERGIKLPQFYVDFLLTMGAGMGKMNASVWNYNLKEVIAEEGDYPRDKYFKFAQATNIDWYTPPDYYLDLSTSDGVDAQIIGVEGEDRSEFDPVPKNLTFADMITEKIFIGFVNKYVEIIFVHCRTREEADTQMKNAINWLATQSVVDLGLPTTSQSKYFRLENVDIAVKIRQSFMLMFELRSDDKESFDRLVIKIMSEIPGAKFLTNR